MPGWLRLHSDSGTEGSGVFPRIDNHQWNTSLGEVGLVIVNLCDQQSFSNGLPNQRGSTGAHDRRSHFRELLAKSREPAEVSLLRTAAFCGHVLPRKCRAGCVRKG
jgi:hypothetical protein